MSSLRRTIAAVILLVGFLAVSCQGAPNYSTGDPVYIRFSPDLSKASPWSVDGSIFGKFFESHGLDAQQGMVEYLLVNGSFEEPNFGESGPATKHFLRVPTFEGVPYPWEPVCRDATGQSSACADGSLQNLPGGIHGKQKPSFQRIEVSSGNMLGGVKQKIVLPDKRTLTYLVNLSVRSTSVEKARVRIEAISGEILAEQVVQADVSWTRQQVQLTLPGVFGKRFSGNPGGTSPWYGVYYLTILAESTGTLDLDWVTMQPCDSVNGRYNPTTIDYFRRFLVTNVRWGGNYSSEYRWKLGVGPLKERPVIDITRGGLQYNYLGTNEFLEFCQLAGVEPILNIGFNRDISPQEAAEWVQYVNGAVDTPMGQLRAQHGYAKPWGVETWIVGNEVYGSYQIGHTDAMDFATRVREYIRAMKAVDPGIKVIVAGIDPVLAKLSNSLGALSEWNETVLSLAGQDIDGIDIHHYAKGIRLGTAAEQRQKRDMWLKQNNADAIGYNEVLVASTSSYEKFIAQLVYAAEERDVGDLAIVVGEWNMQPSVSSGWPIASDLTMGQAAFSAGMLNVFVRQGEHIKMAHHTDFPIYADARPNGFAPPGPSDYTIALYAEPFANNDTSWHFLPVDAAGPTLALPPLELTVDRVTSAPYVDVSSIISHNGDRVYHFLANRDLREGHVVSIQLEKSNFLSAKAVLQHSDSPFRENTDWEKQNGFRIDEWPLVPDAAGMVSIELPPAAVARVEYQFVPSSNADLGSRFDYSVEGQTYGKVQVKSPRSDAVIRSVQPVEVDVIGVSLPLQKVRVEVDGSVLYEAADLPEDLTLRAANLRVGGHTITVYVTDALGNRHQYSQPFVVEHFRILSALTPPGGLKGEASLQLEPVLAPEEVAQATVSLEPLFDKATESIIYSGSTLPTKLTWDTLAYKDGAYELKIQVSTVTALTSTVAQRIAVDNWEVLEDPIRPPQVSGWFGTVERLKTAAKSTGWEYSSGRGDDFLGDSDRIALAANTQEWLIWQMPKLRSYTFMLFARQSKTDSVVIEVSADNKSWVPVKPAVKIAGQSASNWYALELTGTVPTGLNAQYVRLTLMPSDDAVDSVQLGHVVIHGQK